MSIYDPTPREVMDEALEGAGFTPRGMPMARRVWEKLLPQIEGLEKHFSTGGRDACDVEREVFDVVKSIAGGILARGRYAAALKAKRKRAADDLAKRIRAKKRKRAS